MKKKTIIIICMILIFIIGGGLFIAFGGLDLFSNKYYVRTGFKNKETQKGEFDSLKEAKRVCDANAIYGYKVYSSLGKVVYTTYGELVADIMREAKYVTDYIRENGFKYGNAPLNPAIDHSAKTVSCDRLVGWVMYRVGFTDQPENNGLFVWSPGDPRDLEEWCIKNNFKRIDDISDLMPGDIVFVHPKTTAKGTVYPSHTFIHGGVSTDPNYYRYDAGSDHRIQSIQPFSEPLINFMFAYRPVR